MPNAVPDPVPPPAASDYRVDFDWRGESAYYLEPDRRVWVTSIYWGGPTGSVSHIHGVWEFPDGRREPLAADERAYVLERVIERARTHHGITLEIRHA